MAVQSMRSVLICLSLFSASFTFPSKRHMYNGTTTARACSALDLIDSDNLVSISDGQQYDVLANSHWTENTREMPLCIFSPSSAEDAACALEAIHDTGTLFAVRAGGHNANSGWASIDDSGVLISMSRLTDLSYDKDAETVTVGFGSRWDSVYEFLQPFHRTVVGGRCTDVGMGMLLGGGLSYLSTLYGLAADNVVSYRVASAQGTVLTASTTQNADLYWALKGGASNFGIVTHATLRTYPSGKVWGGLVTYNNTDTQDEMMAAFAEYQEAGQAQNPNTAVLTYMLQSLGTTIGTYVALDSDSRPSEFDPFFKIPAVQDQTQVWDSFAEFAIASQAPLQVPRYTVSTTSFRLDKEGYAEVARLCFEESLKLSGIQGAIFGVLPQPISEKLVEASYAAGHSPIGLRKVPQMWFSISVAWDLASDDEEVLSAVDRAIARVEEYTKSRGLHESYIFLNEASASQQPILRYSELERLRNVAKKYDPEEIFQKQMPGGFKLY